MRNRRERRVQKPKKIKIKNNYGKTRKRDIVAPFIIIPILCIYFFAIAKVGIYVAKYINQVRTEFAAIAKELTTIDIANSSIVNEKGEVIAVLNADEKRQIISLDEMSKYLPLAYISIEDERFYEHDGVDIKRTLAAISEYILNKGSSSFGGSSITQQLVKNVTNEREESVERKIKEWIRAYELEKILSKDQILETYLNIIFVGSDVYGVELGAQYYFSKSAAELDIAECAFLAGITNSPNAYNPFGTEDNSEKIRTRTKTVLAKMKELGHITEEEYNLSVEEVEKGLKFKEGNTSENIYSYHTDALIDQVIADVAEQKEISIALAAKYVYSSGLTIYSTENSDIQTAIETEAKDSKYILNSRTREGSTTQAAMVVIDHKTGNVLGCVGGLGEKTVSRGFNRATQSTRQTGSAMKPLSVVGPALQEGVITASSIYSDTKTTFTLSNGQKYTPKNYNYYRGSITVRQSIETSQNIPFIKIMEELTPEKSLAYLRKMGISTLTVNDCGLSLAIGGLDRGISPLEMAGAYATIANGGVYIRPNFYTKVVDLQGNVVLEANTEKVRVFDENVAYVLKNLLTQPVVGSSGTATYCKINGIDVAAKTGTTDSDNDRWLCGFTPYYTGVVWYGYDYKETVIYNGNNPAGLIWSGVMSKIHEGKENATFDVPEGVETAKVCRYTGKVAGRYCYNTYSEVFATGKLAETCTGHYSSTQKTKKTEDKKEEKQETENTTEENTEKIEKNETVEKNEETKKETGQKVNTTTSLEKVETQKIDLQE